ncbi:MAG: S24 family peptidase [Gammaproteobacteria bacterium]|jgi:SOS-response transcriptional repressor LexA|nr:S24 family peptidase [Gammaproteobacteria bacterium]
MEMDMGGCASSELLALQVLGDSMEPEFEDGIVIVIDPTGVIESGSYVLAKDEGEYIFRQLIIEDGRYFLKPVNEGYETREVGGLDVVEGVIVQKAGTRRHQHKHYI